MQGLKMGDQGWVIWFGRGEAILLWKEQCGRGRSGFDCVEEGVWHPTNVPVVGME